MLIVDLFTATDERRRRAWRTAVCCCVFFLLAYGFRSMNLGYTHDSILVHQVLDHRWQISLGRIAQPVYLLVRGSLVSPWLVCLFSVFFLSHAVYLILEQLRIHSALSAVPLCALLCICLPLTSANATFVTWLDIYMCALFLAVLAVAICPRPRWGFPCAVACMCFSLSLYAAYFQAGAVLAVLVAIEALIIGKDARSVFLSGIRQVLMLLCALCVYAALFALVRHVTGISPASSYNGLSGVGDFSGVSIPALLAGTWLYPFRWALKPLCANTPLCVLCYGALIAFILAATPVILRIRRMPLPSAALVLALVLILPMAANCVYFINKGRLMHDLMIYAYLIALTLAPMLCLALRRARPNARLPRAAQALLALCLTLLAADSLIFANTATLRRDLEDQATRSYLTRVLDRIERTPGYVPGETTVAFIGNSYNSHYAFTRPGFEPYTALYGADNNLAITYPNTITWYFSQIAGHPIDVELEARTEELWLDPFVRQMPAFPAEGSVAMHEDGRLIVKLSKMSTDVN